MTTQTPDKLSVINNEWLEKEINETREIIYNCGSDKEKYDFHKGYFTALDRIKANSYQLIPILEDSWDKSSKATKLAHDHLESGVIEINHLFFEYKNKPFFSNQ